MNVIDETEIKQSFSLVDLKINPAISQLFCNCYSPFVGCRNFQKGIGILGAKVYVGILGALQFFRILGLPKFRKYEAPRIPTIIARAPKIPNFLPIRVKPLSQAPNKGIARYNKFGHIKIVSL